MATCGPRRAGGAERERRDRHAGQVPGACARRLSGPPPEGTRSGHAHGDWRGGALGPHVPRGPCTVEGGRVSCTGAFRPDRPLPGPTAFLPPPPHRRPAVPGQCRRPGGPLPRRSSHHAPPLPIRGRGPGLSLPQRAAGGVLCSRTPSWGQQWRAMRRGARPRGAAAGRNSHVARPLPRCLP